ncbi:hypothetical protein Tco_0397455 [Tanacetum coccineum]
MAMTTNENSESESETEETPLEKTNIDTDYKIKTSLEEPPTDLELKPLPDNLEYVFLEEPSFLPVIISSKLSAQNKSKLVSVLKKHKEAFAWKTTDIPGICPSFCKHKIQLLDDKKPVVQKPNMQEVANAFRAMKCPSYVPKMHVGNVEVFMDDFSVFGDSFDKCLSNLDKMLQRCKDAHLVLNWEKCHFMVKEEIVLGHKVSMRGGFLTLPNWNLPFKLMCDASDFAVGVVLGQKDEFDIEIKDTKGTENVAADHLSQIENDESSDDSEVDDNLSEETLMEINTRNEPWFADFTNYLVADIIPKGMTYQQKNKFFSDLKHYFWEEPHLFKVCSDGMIRRYVSEPETQTILDQCHHGLTSGHYGPNVIAKKVLDLGFYWPTIIKKSSYSSLTLQSMPKDGKYIKT